MASNTEGGSSRQFPPVWFESLEARQLLNAAFDITGLTDLRTDPVYSSITGKNIGIAILDTGLFDDHIALTQNVVAWFDAVQNPAGPGVGSQSLSQAFDPNGHGTHVSGTAASSNPDIGVAYGANLIGVRALPASGERQSPLVGDTILNALAWVYYNAAEYNIKVVNMSLGDHSSNVNNVGSLYDADKEKQLIEILESIGITVVTATGNSYGQFAGIPGAQTPAAYSTISVANTWAEQLSSDPDYGIPFGDQRYRSIDNYGSAIPDSFAATSQRSTLPNQIAAPGQNIYSTWNGIDLFNTLDGTSMASPLVSGAVALMQDTAMTFGGHYLTDPDQVLQIIQSTADTIVDSNNTYNKRFDNVTKTTSDLPETGLTFKRINIYKAVQEVRRQVSQSSTNTSTDLNSTLASANKLGMVDGTRTLTTSGTIGTDGPTDVGTNDIDLYKFKLTTWGSLNISLSKPGNAAAFGAALRVFDANGTPLGVAVASGNTYPALYANLSSPLQPGDYYIGVSSSANTAYTTSGTGAANGQTQGSYQLTVTLDTPDPNGVLATATDLDSLQSFSFYQDAKYGWIVDYKISESLGSDPSTPGSSQRKTVTNDVDFYKITVPDTGTLRIDTRAKSVYGSSAPDTYLLVYNQDGNYLTYDDDKTALFDLDSEIDDLAVTAGQTYYIAVTSFGNRYASPTDPRTGRSGNGSGRYDLHVYFTNGDQNGTLASTINRTPDTIGQLTPGILGADKGTPLKGSNSGNKDVDFFRYIPSTDGYFMVAAYGASGVIPVVGIWDFDDATGTMVQRFSGTSADSVQQARGITYQVKANHPVFVSVTGLGNEDFSWIMPGRGSGGTAGSYWMNTSFQPLSIGPSVNNNSVQLGTPTDLSVGTRILGNLGIDSDVTPDADRIDSIIGLDDVDLYRFVPTKTQRLFIRTFTGNSDSADTVLRVFDASGNQLGSNDNFNNATTDSGLFLQATAGQTYYIGVSGAGTNATSYNPLTGAVSGSGSTGDYGLQIAEVPPSISISDATVNESDGSASVTVTLSWVYSSDVTVQYATANNSAIAGSDYTAVSGTLTIAAGQTTGVITIPILNDNLSEADESLTVNLTNPTNGTIADSQALVTILINDLPSLSIADVSVNEDAGNAPLTVSMSQTAPFDISFQVSTLNGTAQSGLDYTAVAGTVTIPANQNGVSFYVPILNDTAPENDETFGVRISNPFHATISRDQATVTIPINDFPTLSITGQTVLENAGQVVLNVNLSAAAPYGITVNYATADGTAHASDDYTATSGTLTIPANTSSATLSVPILDDNLYELAKSFTLSLSNPFHATLLIALATVTIQDDDGTLVPLVSGVAFPYRDDQKNLVTIKLTGPGRGHVVLPGNGLGAGNAIQIKLLDTVPSRSGLSIKVAGKDRQTELPTLEIVGGLGVLNAPATVISQSLTVTGTAKSIALAGISGVLDVGGPNSVTDRIALSLGQVHDLNLNSDTPVSNLKALDWRDLDTLTPDLITTPWIGSLSVTGRKAKGGLAALPGNFEAGLALSARINGFFPAPKLIALGSATIAGAIQDSDWDIAGHVGTVTAAALLRSRIALGEGQTGNDPKLNLKSLVLKGIPFNASASSFEQSQVYLTGTLSSAKLNLVNTTQEIDQPTAERRLGLRADMMNLVSFCSPEINGGKLVSLKKLGTVQDLNNPKANPANVSALTGKFRLMLV